MAGKFDMIFDMFLICQFSFSKRFENGESRMRISIYRFFSSRLTPHDGSGACICQGCFFSGYSSSANELSKIYPTGESMIHYSLPLARNISEIPQDNYERQGLSNITVAEYRA
ncbi:uncharacterized protein LOC120009647 isoform X2 [Tripterygium wilfordii]|uniref:uncharacterized protein LOC120009647 isoform X2 n=1 Tax=Tripterygium wilfordii TaxID=458696 RepID=UPI0018F858A0|nr:uncharacterized protein LOC120009647 isoform X2 [Tripterygium wilfordii]